MAPIEISKIRFCGGKVGDVLAQHGFKTMGDVLKLEYQHLKSLLGQDDQKTVWLRNLAKGICSDEVAEKGPPASAGGIKTFKKVYRFNELEKFISLCCLDINQKI